MAKNITGEYVSKNLSAKEVYGYKDEHNEVSVEIVKEVYKKKHLIVHYPYNKTNGSPAYKFVRGIHYIGFSPDDINGVKKAKNRGYGFTKDTSALIYFLEQDYPTINQIWITKDGESEYQKQKGILILNKDDFYNLYLSIKPENDRHSKERNNLAKDFLASTLPKLFDKSKYEYVKGELHSLLQKIKTHNGKLSDSDLKSLSSAIEEGLFDVSQRVLIDTKKGIDKIYIETVLEEFDKLSGQTGETKTLEKKWQDFFKKHSWIFSFVFAHPVVFLQKEMYVGGMKMSGKGATYADFVYKNKLTKNTAVVEIKTHASILMSASPYRKGADIYSIQSGLSGAIVQVSDQKDKILKNYSHLGVSEPFNPKCIVIAGSTTEFKGKGAKRKIASFELFRSSLSGVEIVTFDEIKEKILLLKTQIELN
ncbi:DUF4263 domain-containing protein [Candidatus Kaiserbacteria bacterium]|nr:MAG: DUF4263 domain-containing protein [Candidatus Kaiserbacteria bacterium]